MNIMTSTFLYGTEYDIYVFIHLPKWQFMSSMFFYGGQPGKFKVVIPILRESFYFFSKIFQNFG